MPVCSQLAANARDSDLVEEHSNTTDVDRFRQDADSRHQERDEHHAFGSLKPLKAKRGQMGRKGSGFRTAVKVVKAIDKAQKQSAREAERRRRARAREEAAQRREDDRRARGAEKARIQHEKARRKAAKEHEKSLFEERAQKRAELRAQFIRSEVD